MPKEQHNTTPEGAKQADSEISEQELEDIAAGSNGSHIEDDYIRQQYWS